MIMRPSGEQSRQQFRNPSGEHARSGGVLATVVRRERVLGGSLVVPIALTLLAAVLAVVIGDRHSRTAVQHGWRAMSQHLAPAGPGGDESVSGGPGTREGARIANASDAVSDPSPSPPALPGGLASAPHGPSMARTPGFRTGESSGRAGSKRGGVGNRAPALLSVDRESGLSLAAVGCPVALPMPAGPPAGRARTNPPFLGEGSLARVWWARVTRFFGMESLRAALDPSASANTTTVASRDQASRSPSPTDSAATASSGGGCLKVAVDEGVAVVVVDGVPRGRTPYAIRVGAGHHTVVARSISASYEPARVALSIAQGDTALAVFHRSASTVSP